MNSYLIQHKIATLTQLWDDPFEQDGFRLCQWNFTIRDGSIGKAWIAEVIEQADDAITAINNFRKRLLPFVDRVAFASQCYSVAELESFSVQKQNDNPENILFFRYSKNCKGVSLHFGDEEKATLAAFAKYPMRGDVFRYLSESINATTFYTRLAMLIAALDAIAGEKESSGRKETDKKYIKNEILKDEKLFERLYAYGQGIRNQLFHGASVDFTKAGTEEYSLPDQIYSKIVAYFNKKHGASISTDVVSAPRNPIGIYQVSNLWLQSNFGQNNLNLRQLTKLYEGKDDRENPEGIWKKFKLVNMPEGY